MRHFHFLPFWMVLDTTLLRRVLIILAVLDGNLVAHNLYLPVRKSGSNCWNAPYCLLSSPR